MWSDPNAFYPLSVPLDDMFDCGIGQLVIMERYKVVVVFRIWKLFVSCNFILNEGLVQYRSNRYDTLLMVFAMDNDEVLINICVLNAAQLPAANTCLKKGSQNRSVPDGKKISAAAMAQHSFDIPGLKGTDNGLFFLTPDKFSSRIEASILFIVAILNKGLYRFQQRIDISPLSAPTTHEKSKALHCAKGNLFCILHPIFRTIAQKEIEVIPITPNRLRGLLPNLNLFQKFFACQRQFHTENLPMFVATGMILYVVVEQELRNNLQLLNSKNAKNNYISEIIATISRYPSCARRSARRRCPPACR